MNRFLMSSLAMAAALVSFAQPAHAQTLTREQVKMDRDTFLAVMRWDESTGMWIMKDNMDPPNGVRSRAEVMAMRDKFMTMNVYDDKTGTWTPVKAGPRDMNKLTREQVKMETEWFLKTHTYDESKSEWVMKSARK